jgi:phage recombination protein Bet
MTAERALVTSSVDPEISAALVVYERLKPLQDALGLANLTVGEMQLFAMVAHHTGLDPFTKQIYAIKRGGKVIHQTGIDGYRSTAERTHEYRGSDLPAFEPCDCGDKDSPAVHPKICRVTVYRQFPEGRVAQAGEARWHELKPKHTQSKSGFGYQDDMWWQQPENQLAKCAEAAALRKAFPRVLGGVYITDEMQQAGDGDNPALAAAAAQPTPQERLKARRAAMEAPAADPAPSQYPPAPAEEGTFRDADTTPEPAAAPESSTAVCGSVSPYEDAGTCGLPSGHLDQPRAMQVHRQLDPSGKVVATWPAAK